jgi:hypothetical protein
MLTFPKGKHDDQVDSTSQALDWIKQGKYVYGVFDALSKQARERGISYRRDSGNDEPPDLSSVVCPKCQGKAIGCYGSQYRCHQCKHTWEPQRDELYACKGPDGQQLEWDPEMELWVDPANGETFEPESDEEFLAEHTDGIP